jgi:hypothetical protein
MATIAQPSVQSLLLEMRFAGSRLSTGTGFVVATRKGPYLITNRHNATGRNQETDAPLSPSGGIPNELVVWHNSKGRLGAWQATVEPLITNGLPRWAEHPALGRRADFVALPLSQLDGVELLPYDISSPANEIQLGPADAVSVIGFPFGVTAGGVFGVWATGFLASEPGVDFNDLPIQLIDCRTRPGQSGSPVIAYRNGGMVTMTNGSQIASSVPIWHFVGIYSGRINAESDLGIVWKVSALRELVSAVET